MVASKLTIFNGCLAEIGERRLTSLSEAREARYACDDVWDRGVVDFCLAQGQWKFAARSVELQSDSDIDTNFGYAYGFEKPSDYIITLKMCSDESFRVPLNDYSFEGAYWYAHIDPLFLQYVSNDSSYGGDYSLWPKEFERYVEAYLASMICMRLTDGMSKREMLEKLVKRRLLDARSSQAMEGPTAFPPAGSWVRSRAGSGGRGDRGSRGTLLG